MKKIVFLVVTFVIVGYWGKAQNNDARQSSFCFFFSGTTEDYAMMKKNAVYHYLRRDRSVSDVDAWILANLYVDSILKEEPKIYTEVKKYNRDTSSSFKILVNNRNFMDIANLIKNKDWETLLNDDCLMKMLKLDRTEITNNTYKGILSEKYSQLTGRKIYCVIKDRAIDNNKLKSTYNMLKNWLSNVRVTILLDINKENIIINNRANDVDNDDVIDEFVRNIKYDKTEFRTVFSERSISAELGKNTNPDTTYYKMIEMDNRFAKEAFFMATDYYFLVTVNNIYLDYLTDGDDNPGWVLTHADLTIQLNSTIGENKSLGNFSYEIKNEIRTDSHGEKSYIELASEFKKYIREMIDMEPQQVSPEITDAGMYLFQQLYKGLAALYNPSKSQGGYYELCVQKDNKGRMNDRCLNSVLTELKENYNFNFDYPQDMKINNVGSVQTKLRECKFNMQEFIAEFIATLDDCSNLTYKRVNSPDHYILLVLDNGRDGRCYNFLNEKVVEINLSNCNCSTTFSSDKLTVTIEDEDLVEYSGKVSYNSQNNVAKVKILKDENNEEAIFKNNQMYTIKLSDDANNTCSVEVTEN